MISSSTFSYAVTSSAVDGYSLHSWPCPDCLVGPLTALVVVMDPSCQSMLLTVGSVGSRGSVTATSYASSPLTTLPSASDPVIAAVTAVVATVMEVHNDTTAAGGYAVTRGYKVSMTAEPGGVL